MTGPDLAGALAAQRSAYAPDHVPPFAGLVARRRRKDRRQWAVAAGAMAVTVAAGAAVLTPLLDRRDTASGTVAAGREASTPDAQRLRDAFDANASGIPFFGSVQTTPSGEYDVAGRSRQQAEGVQGETADKTTSVTWTVVTPALSDLEVLSMASTVEGNKGVEQGKRVPSDADQSGPVKSVAFRFGDGSFLGVRAWSSDGGYLALTSGNGAAVTDNQIRAWEAAMRGLLVT